MRRVLPELPKCTVCGRSEPEVKFRLYSVSGRWYEKHQCRGCESKQRSRRATIARSFNKTLYRNIDAERQRRRHSYVVVYDPNGLFENGMFRGSEIRDSVRWGEEWVEGLVFRRLKDNKLYKAVGYTLKTV